MQAGSQDRRIAGSQDRRIAGSQDRRIAGSQDRRIARLQDRFARGAFLPSLMLAVATSCTPQELESPNPNEREPVTSSREPFSAAGIERVIPLRIIQTEHLSSADQLNLYSQMLRQVQSANAVFHSAGLQFYIKVFKECSSTGLLYDEAAVIPYFWIDVKADIWCAIPGSDGQDFPGDLSPWTKKDPWAWENWATFEYGDPSEIVVWVKHDGHPHNASGPWSGNCVHFEHIDSNAAKLAHELGHGLGIFHPSAATGVVGDTRYRDPETGNLFQYGDFWDIVYKPGTPNTYYSNWGSVPSSGLANIDTGCTWDLQHRITCTHGTQTVTWPCTDPSCALKGLAFTFTTEDNQQAGLYKYGGNLMSGFHENYQNGISDSNIYIIRKFLRYDTVLTTTESGSDHQGKINQTSRRGQWLNRQPAYVLDFNHDGSRDFGWWEQPIAAGVNGTFHVILSNGGGTMNVPFGQLGDIPVPADYNGDGFTDIGVFQPGGGWNRQDPLSTSAYWGYCPTNTQNPSQTGCPAPMWFQFGEREDVPLPGLDFDGLASTGHLAIFRPSSHVWAWGPVANYDPNYTTVRWLGEITTRVPLPGRYDSDTKADIAAYDTVTGKFHLSLSSLGWNTTIVRQLPPSTYSDSGTTPMPRGVPVPGMISHVYYSGSYQPRNAIALFWPDSGYWNVMWNPGYNSTYSSCQWARMVTCRSAELAPIIAPSPRRATAG